MKKNKLLAIAPVMPQETDIESLAETLSFFHERYDIDFIDPLTHMNDSNNDAYYQQWKLALNKYLPNYDAFVGFSFGGVILQQCFSLFASLDKPIILFSTPTFADDALSEKLGSVISLCKENQVIEALTCLYRDVFYPHHRPLQFPENFNQEKAKKRLIFGLTRVLDTNSTQIMAESTVKHLHFTGEQSHLVNAQNISIPKHGRLITVPGAGMRVLEDNLSFCKKIIGEIMPL
ncbi:MAG: hypothetical protein Q8M03_03310 [Legionella sp.]|nr:hypothetical protein [Legionella sp.]